MVIKQAKLIH